MVNMNALYVLSVEAILFISIFSMAVGGGIVYFFNRKR